MQFRTLAIAFAIAGIAAGSAYAAQDNQAAKNGAYCLQSSTGTKNCTFASMAACNAAKKGSADKCDRNPQATTGSGASQSSDSMKKK